MKKEEKEKWAVILSKYLVVTEKHKTRFCDLSAYLTEIAERLFNRRFSHQLKTWDISYIAKKAGGYSKKSNGGIRRWNIGFVCEPWPTVLLPAKPSISDLKQSYLKRKRNIEIDRQAYDLFLLLTRGEK